MRVEKKDGVVVISLEGRMDVYKSLEVENEVNKYIDSGEKFIVFDLENVKYMSSSGIRVLIATLRRLKEMGGTVKLANLNPSVKKIFKLVELEDLFETYGSVDEAVKSIVG